MFDNDYNYNPNMRGYGKNAEGGNVPDYWDKNPKTKSNYDDQRISNTWDSNNFISRNDIKEFKEEFENAYTNFLLLPFKLIYKLLFIIFISFPKLLCNVFRKIFIVLNRSIKCVLSFFKKINYKKVAYIILRIFCFLTATFILFTISYLSKESELTEKFEENQEYNTVATKKISNFVYVTRTGKRYHSEYCPTLKYSADEVDIDTAEERGLTACQVCGGRDYIVTHEYVNRTAEEAEKAQKEFEHHKILVYIKFSVVLLIHLALLHFILKVIFSWNWDDKFFNKNG